MSLNFQTTLNGRQHELPFEAFYKGRNYKGTVNIKDAQIYKQDGTKYSPSY